MKENWNYKNTKNKNIENSLLLSSSWITAMGLCMTLMASNVQAIPLLTFGNLNNGGFGDLAMLPNDDGSSSQLDLPFDINFFGSVYDSFWVNNNGNITFEGPVGTYTPSSFPISSNPMIAPFWGDVDTRCADCGSVFVGAPNSSTVMVTWNNVGFFPSDSSLTNNFQLLLRDQGAGDFDIEFRYDQLAWTTGSASGGVGGLGGIPAQAGFDAGDFTNFFMLPGSRTAAVLDLQNTTNVAGGEDGFWSFAIRNGLVPGSTPGNPLLPVIQDDGFNFDFNVNLNQRVFIDPDIAVGYEYVVDSGPNFASVLIPSALPNGDSAFELHVNGMTFDLFAGTVFDFTGLNPFGFDHFSIDGIDTNEMLNPNDAFAFVTGLTFVDSGVVSMRQIPSIISVVPEPETYAMLLAGLGLLSLMMRRSKEIPV